MTISDWIQTCNGYKIEKYSELRDRYIKLWFIVLPQIIEISSWNIYIHTLAKFGIGWFEMKIASYDFHILQ